MLRIEKRMLELSTVDLVAIVEQLGLVPLEILVRKASRCYSYVHVR